MRVRLAHETDFAGFRAQARALLARGVRPRQVHWCIGDQADLLAADDTPSEPTALPRMGVTVPAAFLELCHLVVLHREPQRFDLLYRLLWRLAHDPRLRHDRLDPEMARARQLAQAVRRELHRMQAFVRFRPVDDGDPADPLQVAWFEPAQRVVDEVAPWFARRFANLRWAILTPERSVAWDRQALNFGPGAGRAQAPPPDAGERLWLTYYASIFNPARLNLPGLQRHMPRRYWHDLPEARLIAPLVAAAPERSGRMLAQPPVPPPARLPRPVTPPAAAPGALAALHAAMQGCRDCPLGAAATQAVPGEGPLAPALMFVGEQPGDQEDLRGRPFVGPAGQLFERALAEAGLDRQAVFVTNAVRHFKFELRGKRRIHKTPTQQEAATCRRWLDEEIALVQPKALVALGGTAGRALLGQPVAVSAERGRWFQRPDGLPVLLTLHPSALLRLPGQAQPAAYDAFVRDLALAARGPGR